MSAHFWAFVVRSCIICRLISIDEEYASKERELKEKHDQELLEVSAQQQSEVVVQNVEVKEESSSLQNANKIIIVEGENKEQKRAEKKREESCKET